MSRRRADEQTAGDIIAILKKLAREERQKYCRVVTHNSKEIGGGIDVVLELVAVASLRKKQVKITYGVVTCFISHVNI